VKYPVCNAYPSRLVMGRVRVSSVSTSALTRPRALVGCTLNTEDLYDSRGVYFGYPVYVLTDGADEVAVIGGSSGMWLLLFTDLDNAETYIDHGPLADHYPFELSTPQHLRVVLNLAVRAGVQSVALDPDGKGRRRASIFPVDHLLSCLREPT